MARKKFSTYSFGKRDLQSENHWKPLPLNQFKIDKATVVCLGGNGTIIDRKTNNLCKLAESLMGIKVEAAQNPDTAYKDVNIVGFTYGTDLQDDNIGNFSREECDEIASQLFLPLCTDQNGALLPVNESCKNFSLLTFFTHCYGADGLAGILSSLNNQLLDKGYSKDDIHLIFGQSMQVAYSPFHNDTWVPTVRIDSMTDSFHRDLNCSYPAIYGHKLNGIESYVDKAGTFRGNKYPYTKHDTLSIYTSRLINTRENSDIRYLIDEHTIYYLQRDEKWQSDGSSVWENNGNDPWREKPQNLDVVSQTVGYALARSVANSINNANSTELIEKPSMEQMKTEMDTILQSLPQSTLGIPPVQ